MKMTNVDEFCDNNGINAMGISVDILEGKKYLAKSAKYGGLRANNDWLKTYDSKLFQKCKDIEEQRELLAKKRKHFKHRGMDTSKVFHIDVDIDNNEIDKIPENWWRFIEQWKEGTSYYQSTTKKRGLHLLFTVEDFTPSQCSYQTIFDLRPEGLKSHIEILTGTWGWIPADTKIIDRGFIQEIPVAGLDTFIKRDTEKIDCDRKNNYSEKKKTNKKRIMLDKKDMNDTQKLYVDLGNIIKLRYLDDYETWTRIVWSLANDKDNENYSIAKALSQRSEKYDEDVFNRLWDGSKSGNTIGTFFHYAIESDRQKYNEIRAEYFSDFEVICDDDSLARFYIESNTPNHVFERRTGELHTYFRGKWKQEGNSHGLLKLQIHEQITAFAVELKKNLCSEICKLAKTENEWEKNMLAVLEKREKAVNKLIAKINSTAKINSVEQRVQHYLAATDNEVEFDFRPELIAFKNVVFDLSIGQVIEPKREDYILKNTGYDYVDCPEEDIQKMREILDSILPDKEVWETYIHFLALGLTGYNPEKFLIANGGGRNGKGVLNELVEDMLGGEYYYTAPSELLLNAKKLGGSPELATMDKKRMVIFREPDCSKKLNSAFIKELTGGNKIAGRMNYSNQMVVLLTATWILECNEKPMLTGNVSGEAIGKRIMDVPFVNTFTKDENMLSCEGFYKQDPYYKTLEFRRQFRIPLFKILLDYMREYLDKTGKHVWEKHPQYKCIEDRTKKYLESSDEIKCWLRETLVSVPWTDKSEMYTGQQYITTKDIYSAFKTSELFGNMSKEERRKHNESFFRDYINTTNPYRKQYEERYKNKRSLLFGYQINWGNDSDNDLDI
jgi:phage/plasmid-associated DNA primase